MNWSTRRADFPVFSRTLRSGAGVLLAFALAVGAPSVAGAKSKDKKKKEHREEKADGADGAAGIFGVPFPIGHGASGIKLPDRGPDGHLRMSFEIGSAFRVDETHLKLQNLRIETFDEAGKLDIIIEMPESLMDIQTRVLTSVNPVTIRHSDFEVTGGNMTFDTKTREGKFSGPVRVLIFNRDNFDLAQKGEISGE